MPSSLWLLHLSDIHFRKTDKVTYDPYDLDMDLRDQLEADIVRVKKQHINNVEGIIVNGDIAFAGRESEYDVALGWLKTLSDKCGSNPAKVWCVPGNHDVDRSIHDKSVNLKNIHNMLRPIAPSNIDALLGEALRDPESAANIFKPIEQYNRFASKFRCSSSVANLFWQHDLKLNDGWTLRLHGANSTLVSDGSDDNKSRKLIVGTKQATPKEQPGVAVVFICHHPLDWLMDYDEITPNLNARAPVQLFGHKHSQAIEHLNGSSLRIIAGAVHPDRREPKWKPRYNWLGFSVIPNKDTPLLQVEVFPRVWSDYEPKFIADYALCGGGAESRKYLMQLPPWECEAASHASELLVESELRIIPVGDGTPISMAIGIESMDAAKTLTYRFLSLSHLVRIEIAQEMKLLQEDDEGLFDAELFDRVLARAASEHRLADLWNKVEERHNDGKNPVNPYIEKLPGDIARA